MSEIDKLYKNAKIEPDIDYIWDIEPPCEESLLCNGCEESSRSCDRVKSYPEFTAEKRLELIKWLAIRFNSDYMSYWHNEIKDIWIFQLHDLTEFSSEEPCIYEGRNKDFTEALCNLINDLWQDLTEEEEQQVKGILE